VDIILEGIVGLRALGHKSESRGFNKTILRVQVYDKKGIVTADFFFQGIRP
jgi:hypothetical protein